MQSKATATGDIFAGTLLLCVLSSGAHLSCTRWYRDPSPPSPLGPQVAPFAACSLHDGPTASFGHETSGNRRYLACAIAGLPGTPPSIPQNSYSRASLKAWHWTHARTREITLWAQLEVSPQNGNPHRLDSDPQKVESCPHRHQLALDHAGAWAVLDGN
ncbi:hypothetical protein B0T13DRAFT_452320 [Neurospora crassa]|nr:hypothetical protein B0T13DRAFT_452320 [Neurospora crassa]